MKTYTITSAQMTEVLAALDYGAAILSDSNRGGAFPSKEVITKKLAKAYKDLALIEFEG